MSSDLFKIGIEQKQKKTDKSNTPEKVDAKDETKELS